MALSPTSKSTSMCGQPTPVRFTPCFHYCPLVDAQLLKILDYQDVKAEIELPGQSYSS